MLSAVPLWHNALAPASSVVSEARGRGRFAQSRPCAPSHPLPFCWVQFKCVRPRTDVPVYNWRVRSTAVALGPCPSGLAKARGADSLLLDLVVGLRNLPFLLSGENSPVRDGRRPNRTTRSESALTTF